MGYRNPGSAGAPNLKIQRFVEAYSGDGKAAAIAAGYAPDSANRTAYKLLQDSRVVALIEEREKKSAHPLIRSRVKRQEWLVKVLEDVALEMKDRIKAMELLKRSCGDFLDRMEIEHVHVAALPPDIDAETLRAIARGGLRPLPALVESTAVEDDDDGSPPGPH